ncbi:MAG: sulfotransferase family 2 domain-containing protein [Pseudomonadota bacterium]|nr:sulfotransferase family 2 domain-containing protein [Pseudomonadota bacterium]
MQEKTASNRRGTAVPVVPEQSPALAPAKNILSGFVCVCVRVPKSGSASLTASLKDGFAGRHIFRLPDTLSPDSNFSLLQRYRAARSRLQTLMCDHRTLSLAKACRKIAREAADGDLINGGHIDFASVASNIPRRLKMITILRDPAARALSDYNYSRQSYFKKTWVCRFDAGILPKAAARYSFEGYLDFLTEHCVLYGNLASRYVGWNGSDDLRLFFRRNVFHAGTLEKHRTFAKGLSEKLGRKLDFPHENRTGTAAATAIGADARAKIERLYARDYVLYQWVHDRL